ncbi:hypothetical protein QLX08_003109 [Tetragonisca angustula]|uniref:Uncharacterized protein n=1 Tax=Tetragonisca angustula TaxID=166442 RepID=A0AAW1AAH1_9HYME
MFGRQTFLEPVDNQYNERRNEYIRQFSANQRQGVPFNSLVNIPSLRNDGLMFDLNFIFLEDNDHGQPNNLRTLVNPGNISNRYLLEYIRQMKERYLIMERELTRTKMLIPVIMRNINTIHQSSQTDVNWKQCSLTKYGHLLETSSKNQYKRNQEQIKILSRRKHYMKKNKDSISKILGDPDCMKYKNSSQNQQNDIYPIKEPDTNTFQRRILTGNSTAVCSMHNIAVILPQDSTQLTNSLEYKQTNSKVNNKIHKPDSDDSKIIFGKSRKHFGGFETQKTSMEACQSFDKKHEPETSYHTNFDVKHEDHTQTKPTVYAPEFRPVMGSKFNSDISDQSTSHCQQQNIHAEEKCMFKRNKFFENIDAHRKDNFDVRQIPQSNRNYWNNHAKKLSSERTCYTNDSSRQFTRTVQKQKKELYKKMPTPRSNVHTAYTPIMQPLTWNSMLDPNGFTIQLLRLAVLLYAPALMPALNSLIARQSIQTTIPIPCSEGSNDLLTQIFTILSSQQCVPNLQYTASPPIDENSGQFRDSNSHNLSSQSNSLSENLSRQQQDDACSTKTFENNQFEKNSIAVNTSLKICNCNNMKQSFSQYSKNTLHDQVEENERLMYSWTNKTSKSSETVVLQCEQKEKNSGKESEDSELSQTLLVQKNTDVWDAQNWNETIEF